MILFLFVIGCTTVHPITEAPYISLEFGVDRVHQDDFPKSLVDSLQWNDLASAELSSVSEEVHIALKSDFPPHYLFRVNNDKNNSGFTKTISPININSIAVTSATECD